MVEDKAEKKRLVKADSRRIGQAVDALLVPEPDPVTEA